jgi:hypothetical protein
LTTPKTRGQKARTDTFESTAIDEISFSDDPAFRPGRGRRQPTTDAAAFTGAGRWNGAGGYTFEARATDAGEPGRGHDTFAITIRRSNGVIVVETTATLTTGNIQSRRLPGGR